MGNIFQQLRVLAGGIPIPLKNMSLSVGMMTFPIYGKSEKSCSKQPTRLDCQIVFIVQKAHTHTH